jgi:hypothetical protein
MVSDYSDFVGADQDRIGEMGLVRLLLLGFGIYVVVTAPVEQQVRMYAGVHAFISAAVAACTSEGRPCTTALGKLGSIRVAEKLEPARQARVAPLDDPGQANAPRRF